MTVLITLTTAGTDTDNFSLYSNTDGYVTAFATGISRASLLTGYSSAVVPNGTTIIRANSNGTCTNYTDISIVGTTTTTTTIPNPATSILSFTYSAGIFTFTLSNAIPSTSITILTATVNGSIDSVACAANTVIQTDGSSLVISAGATTNFVSGDTLMNCDVTYWKRGSSVSISGYGSFTDGQVVTIAGTAVTISIPSTCVAYVCTPGNLVILSGGPLLIDACGTSVSSFTQLGATITTGTILYTDDALTTAITGWNYVADENGLIYNIDSVTGVIGTYTGTNC
jgi:hypothetical protein